MRNDVGDARAWSTGVQVTQFVSPPVAVPGATTQSLHAVTPGALAAVSEPRSEPRGLESPLISQAMTVTVLGLAASLWLGLSVLVTLWLAVASLAIVYRRRDALSRHGRPELGSLVGELAVAYAVVALAVGAGLTDSGTLTGSAVVLAVAGLAIAATTALRSAARGPARVLVVGDRSAISRGAMRWASGDHVHVVGGLLTDADADGTEPRSIAGVPTVLGLDDVAHWAEVWSADLVVVSPGRGVHGPDLRRLGWLLEGSPVGLAVVDVADSAAPHRLHASSYGGATFLHLADPTPSALVQGCKAAVDRIGAALLLALLSPVLAVLVVMVRVDSRGPGFFRQTRVGKDGAYFRIFKLRTMSVHAERDRTALLERNEGSGPLFKLHDDPRVTRVGHFLRRTSLDELPQLLNVVRGEMSLVGPRPALPTEVAEYDDVELRRLAVKPGMTGLWQVSGRSNLSWESGLAFDLHYADNWRLVDDALICLRTVDAVVRGNGAY